MASKGHHIFPPFLERQLTPGCDALPCLLLLGGALLNRTVWVRALSDLLGTAVVALVVAVLALVAMLAEIVAMVVVVVVARHSPGFLVGGASSRLFWKLICQGSRSGNFAPGWGLKKLEFLVVV